MSGLTRLGGKLVGVFEVCLVSGGIVMEGDTGH
jgi:hypothetical protein